VNTLHNLGVTSFHDVAKNKRQVKNIAESHRPTVRSICLKRSHHCVILRSFSLPWRW